MEPPMTFALVTPSYRGDFERCALLVESVQRFVPKVPHYLLVDRRDLAVFEPLAGEQTHVLAAESMLPWWIFRPPLVDKWFMNLKGMPVRNWIFQQLVKLSVDRVCNEDVLIYLDSDIVFLRPFAPSSLVRDEKLALRRVPFDDDNNRRWRQGAKELLGIPDADLPAVTYVSNLIPWRRDNLVALHDHIANLNGKPWLDCVLKHWSLSEYTIYGVFVEQVLGMEKAGHFPWTESIMALSWNNPFDSADQIDQFIDGMTDDEVAVMIHSKDGVPVSLIRECVERRWAETPA